ncbi:hypothetical protein [Hansschlegelia sp. KR7-227]|uniref:hypothetical protein n=1 Tax=Hansschlegelia sp. KR7-227 TaxID=3400914 RepID=UPI003BFB4B29
MTDPAAPKIADVQLGARARSILKSLAATGQAKLAPRGAEGSSARPGPDARGMTSDDNEAGPAAGRGRLARRAAPAGDEAAAASDGRGGPLATRGSNTVVPLPRRDVPGRRAPNLPDAAVARPAPRAAAGRSKKNFVKISAVFAIALPTFLASIYYGFIAAPQYVAEARFAVRGPDDGGSGGGDLMGALTGIGGSAAPMISDSFIVSQFIESGQLVGNLQRTLDLRAIYSHSNADFLARYRPYDFEDTIEHLTLFWNSVAWVYFEPISGIITFNVRAFTPEDALKIARETVRESEKLVNKLSERAREDTISVTKQEQSRAELRLKFARKAIQDFRDRKGATDPTSVATAQSQIVADLESQLAKQEAELQAANAFLNRDAPTVRVMRNAVDALKSRIATEKAKIGSVAPNSQGQLISASMAEFENLATERDFAQKAYEQASQSVEAARMRAERQARYIATFVEPHMPEDSLYPKRLQMIFLVLLCSTLAWAIGVLVFYGIRDHSA